MKDKSTTTLTLMIVAVNAAALLGVYALAGSQAEPMAPYVDDGFTPRGHEWARDQAVAYLELGEPESWAFEDVTDPGLLGSAAYRYTATGLEVTVSHCLNPTADYHVTVETEGRTWSGWVGQSGEVRATS
jgi:hypothetical protein